MKFVIFQTRFPVWLTFSTIARLRCWQSDEFVVIVDPSNAQDVFDKEYGQALRKGDSILQPHDPRKSNRRCVLGGVCRQSERQVLP